jgi:hypothetical protein
MIDLIDSVLSMSLDVYRQTDSQDPNTGAIRKEWIFIKRLPCHAKGIISNSASARNSDRQVFNNKYLNDQVIQVRTSERLTLREKVTNIVDSSGTPIWIELNTPTDTPTVFEVIGTTPITDPFGKAIGYNSTMKRSENQVIGI